ncbi:MAG: hypothetical protein ACOCQD_02200 [archaeon]
MIKIKNVTLRNFFSVGAITQAINLDLNNFTLVMGSNRDIDGDSDNTKNAVGKTSLMNAISYALYGNSLSNVKKTNLVNKTNKKNMVVTIDFSKNDNEYRIERGRSPNFLRFFINDTEQEIIDESHGDSRKTQEQIDSLLGMSHSMFKNIVALNTYSEPFLSMKTSDQRLIIEQLLGITQLSEKADSLKELIKGVKEKILIEKTHIDSIENSNNKIKQTIDNLRRKQTLWFNEKQKNIHDLSEKIQKLQELDIDDELKKHELLNELTEKQKNRDDLILKQKNINKIIESHINHASKLDSELNELGKSLCYACGQTILKEKQQEIIEKKNNELYIIADELEKSQNQLTEINKKLDSLDEIPDLPVTFYNSYKEAYEHFNNVERLKSNLEYKQNEINPYEDQIEDLKKTAIQTVEWDTINSLQSYLEHQEVLLKLLTNKDSFIRKKIIDQNLSYLNHRLTNYLSELGLPHQVVFKNDLDVDISLMGQELDFDNLSRGERTRLILGLSFAFRDVWENLNHSINLIMIDELLDSGLDGSGIECSLSVLKKMSRNNKKNVFLISHREEFVGRVNCVLNVIKENGFTHFDLEENEN